MALDARTVRVTRQLYYHDAGHSFGPPKSRAGVRDVDLPELIVPDLREHLVWVPSSALVFASSTGEARRAELAKSRPREAAELEGTRRARAWVLVVLVLVVVAGL